MSETSSADLLQTAREVLRAEIVPGLAPALRFQAAMIANAIAIAARELEQGASGNAALSAGYRKLYPDAALPLAALERRLASDIRAGRFDRDHDGRLRSFLVERTRVRLRISNPARLGAGGFEPARCARAAAESPLTLPRGGS